MPAARRLAAALLAAVLTVSLAACGEKKESLAATQSKSLDLLLDYLPNADHVGIYQALAEGDFRNAGLDVHVRAPSDPALPLRLLAAGKTDIAISYEPELMLARDRGQPLVAIGALVQQPLTSIIALGAKHIRTAADLRGKRVGDAGIAYQQAYLSTILQSAGVPAGSVHRTSVGFNLVPAMLSGGVDATLGGYWNYEGLQLQLQHRNPTIIRVDQAGVPTYDELVLVVTRKTLATKTDQLRQFVQALAKGYASAQTNPAAAVANLVHAVPGLDPKLQSESVRVTLPAFFPSGTDAHNPWGWQDQNQWNAYGSWMLAHRLITNPQAVADASTNELLAGQGPP